MEHREVPVVAKSYRKMTVFTRLQTPAYKNHSVQELILNYRIKDAASRAQDKSDKIWARVAKSEVSGSGHLAMTLIID